jgi:uncharacterized membrane protein YczE
MRKKNYSATALDLLSALASFDFFLAAVFLWISFLAAALSIALTVLLNIGSTPSPALIAALHFFIVDFSVDFLTTFFNAFAFVTLTRLIADLIFGTLFTSRIKIDINKAPNS